MLNHNHLWKLISSRAAEQMLVAPTKLIDLGAKPLLEMTRPQADSSLLTAGILRFNTGRWYS